MKNYTNKSLFITMLFLLMTSSTLYADKDLVITPYQQWGSNTSPPPQKMQIIILAVN